MPPAVHPEPGVSAAAVISGDDAAVAGKDTGAAGGAMPLLTPIRTSPRPRAETPTPLESVAAEPSAETGRDGHWPGERGTGHASTSARVTGTAQKHLTKSRRLPVWEYVQAELGLSASGKAHDPDMAVARERVFDIIWYIPVEFERLNLYGSALCADAVIGVVTSLPVRVLCHTWRLVQGQGRAVFGSRFLGGSWQSGVADQSKAAQSSSVLGHNNQYAREHLSDSLWLFILVGATFAAGRVDVSVLYHYIRGQEVIKLYLACSVLECFDKLCSSFNCHVLDALSHSASVAVAGGKSKSHTLHTWLQLLFDTALATATTTAHTLILLTHAVTLSVAINSHTNAMLLVLISNNFGEIKGHVFKKMDDAKVFTAARMDIVERVHLSVELLFVAAQRVTASGSFTMGLDAKLLKDTAMVLGSEVFVDVFKHAFISKFNGLRPRVYRGFFRQLCREHVRLPQSYKLHRVVGFVPIAPAALLLKALPGVYNTFAKNASSEFSWMSFVAKKGRVLAGYLVTRFGFESFLDVSLSSGDVRSSSESNLLASVTTMMSRFDASAADASASTNTKTVLDSFFCALTQNSLSFRDVLWFAVGFCVLVVFKMLFGVALHWFGAYMLDTLPKDVGGDNQRTSASRPSSRANSPKRSDTSHEPSDTSSHEPNPWRDPGTRVLFPTKPPVDGKSDKGDKANINKAKLTSKEKSFVDFSRVGESANDDDEDDSLKNDDSKTNAPSKTGEFSDGNELGDRVVAVRGDASSPFAETNCTPGGESKKNTTTPRSAPVSPTRASNEPLFTPGSPHYKLYPDYPLSN